MQLDGVLEFSLLDVMAILVRRECLSDLHNLQDWEAIRLSKRLEQVPANAATLFEWNDALAYLVAAPPEQTREAAKEQLMTFLTRSRDI